MVSNKQRFERIETSLAELSEVMRSLIAQRGNHSSKEGSGRRWDRHHDGEDRLQGSDTEQCSQRTHRGLHRSHDGTRQACDEHSSFQDHDKCGGADRQGWHDKEGHRNQGLHPFTAYPNPFRRDGSESDNNGESEEQTAELESQSQSPLVVSDDFEDDKIGKYSLDFPSRDCSSEKYSGVLLLARVIAMTICVTLAASMAARLGPTSMAAFQICLQVWMTSSLLDDGLAVAGQAILARAFAEKDYQKATAAAARVLQMSAAAFTKDLLDLEGQLAPILKILEEGSSVKVFGCIFELKAYHECKQLTGGNRIYKPTRSPLVVHSAGRIYPQTRGFVSHDNCRRLDMSVSSNKPMAWESDIKRLEGLLHPWNWCNLNIERENEQQSLLIHVKNGVAGFAWKL